MDLKRMLSGCWFSRLVFVSWIICAISVLVLFKNIELIVHGQLYYHGLVFSAEWADPFRIFTWLIYLCLGVPTALSGIAVVSSFFAVESTRKKGVVIQRKGMPSRGAVKLESRPTIKESPKKAETFKEPSLKNEIVKREPKRIESTKTVPKRIEADNEFNVSGISCPNCKKIFGRALVMLDFRSGKNRLVRVCPYCNYILGYTSEEKNANEDFYVGLENEEVSRD